MSRTTNIRPLVRVLAYGAGGIVVILNAVLLSRSSLDRWPFTVLLAAVAVGLTLGRSRFSRFMTLSMTEFPIVAAFLLLDPAQAMLVGVLVGIVPRGPMGMLSRAVNAVHFGLPVLAAASFFTAATAGLGINGPAAAPFAWFCMAIFAVAIDTALHFTSHGLWLRMTQGMPVREYVADIVLPWLKNDPVSGLLMVPIVEIALLVPGPAVFLPFMIMVVAGCGMWFTMKASSRQVEARELKDDFFRAIFVSLARLLEMKDPETAIHSARVAVFSRDLARQLGLTVEEQSRIHLAGLLHDVGKVGVPDDILLKPGRLTAEERATMERHARLSAEAIQGIPGFADLVRMVYAHHERLDGSGYPEGLLDVDIPLGARILGVADTFEALTSDRPYRKGRTGAQALEIFAAEGHLFDPEVVLALRHLVLSGKAESAVGTFSDFSKEWSKAARHLEVRLDEAPFILPPERPRHPFAIVPLDDAARPVEESSPRSTPFAEVSP